MLGQGAQGGRCRQWAWLGRGPQEQESTHSEERVLSD